jgi:hypothetical protein
LQHVTKKSNNSKKVLNVTQPTRGKRVVAPMQPGRLTRSGLLVRPEVPTATTKAEIPNQARSEVHAAVTQDEIPIQATSEVQTANTQAKILIQATSEVQVANTQAEIPI